MKGTRRIFVVVAVAVVVLGAAAILSVSLWDTGAPRRVYWANVGDGLMNAIPVGGGRTTTIDYGNTNSWYERLSADRRHVYWIDGSGTINVVPIGGGSVTTHPRGPTGSVAIVDGSHVLFEDCHDTGTLDNRLGYPGGIVAVAGTHIYWIEGGPAAEGTVVEGPLGGCGVTPLAYGNPTSVAVDGTHVYWVDAGAETGAGTVNKVPLAGGPVVPGRVTTLATNQDYPASVAVDGTHVYWVNYADGTVNEVPLGGGHVTTLASGQTHPNAVAVDGAHVYWTNQGSTDKSGTVDEVPLGGGRVTILARRQDSPHLVTVAP